MVNESSTLGLRLVLHRDSCACSTSPDAPKGFRCAPQVNSLDTLSKNLLVQQTRLTNAGVFDDPHEPPVAVGVIEQHHGVTLRSVRLAFDRCNECV